MRDFARTPEPAGRARPLAAGSSFVVQKHAARQLHYDFRLELDGVLLSWAVPKGPSLDTRQRRLAMRVEDHPLEYRDFEGIIPKGQYGGGTVLVWDRGSWRPEGDAHEALRKGHLTFTLEGDKLEGRWHLVRTGGRRAGAGDAGETAKEAWLLFKGRDEAAHAGADIETAQPRSVLSGRTIEEIAEAPARVWQSNRGPGARAAAARARRPPAMSTANVREIAALAGQLPTRIKLTNLEKVLYPGANISKGALIAYVATVAPRMLPQVAGRPLALVRCPDGHHRQCFYQKHVKDTFGGAIGEVPVVEANAKHARDVEQHPRIDDLDGLIALVQLGVLEIHTWGAHADNIERPDQLIFDFDPDPALGWDPVVEAALAMRQALRELGLESFVKTTGGKGLHVVAPIARRTSWDDCKAFARAVAGHFVAAQPDRYGINPLKATRKHKIFIDYLRNGRGATAIAPYSPRAREGATVAMPVTWDELAQGIDPAAFTVLTVPARLAGQTRDPWAGYDDVKQSLTAAMRRRVGPG